MLQRVKEVQESDLRMDGALARNIQRVIAVTQADVDAAAAQGHAWVVKPVVKVSDPLDNLRGGTQLVIKQNSILPGQNVMRVLYIGNSKTVGPAVAPLSLPGAAADDIISLIAFGGTIQGAPNGYTLLNGVANGANTAVATGIQPAVDDVEWEVRVKPTTDSWYILQARTGGQSIWGVSGSTTGSTILLGWNGNQSLLQSDITRDSTHIYYVKATVKNGVATLYVKDETAGTEDTQTTTYTFDAEKLPSSQFYLFANGNPQYVAAGNKVFMARIKVGGVTVMDYVPALNPSNVVGFYDRATGNFKVSITGTLVADQTLVPTPTTPVDIVSNNGVLKWDSVNQTVYADGSQETIAIKDDQSATVSTAVAEMLLSVGDYTDEQEIITGGITRKCGVLVFDGTETFWNNQISNNGRVFIRSADINCITVSVRYADYFCSHFLPTTASSPLPGSTAITAAGIFFWVQSNITTLTEWTDWLAAQYAAGTPVIIVYPLATQTTDTVTPQPMQTVAGDNTAEITQAGMAGLELEVEYVEA